MPVDDDVTNREFAQIEITTKILSGRKLYNNRGYFNLNLNAGSDPDVTEMKASYSKDR